MTETKVLDQMANAKTRLPRILLPADNGGMFTPKDILPKKGEEHGSHDVQRRIRVIRNLKSGIYGFLLRKGVIYRVQWNEETERWDALSRLEGKALENAQAAIAKERKETVAENAEKADAAPAPKAKAPAKKSKGASVAARAKATRAKLEAEATPAS